MIHEKKCSDETEELLQIYDNNVRKEETKASDTQMAVNKICLSFDVEANIHGISASRNKVNVACWVK